MSYSELVTTYSTANSTKIRFLSSMIDFERTMSRPLRSLLMARHPLRM